MTFGMSPETPPATSTRATNPVAWHYTGPDGLIGILSSSRFWASDPVILNDRGELKYGFEIVLSEWRAMRDDPSISPSVRAFLDETLSDDWLTNLMESVFIVSASSSAALASQWLNYARADGFAIGFDRESMWWPVPKGVGQINASELKQVPSIGPVWLEVDYEPERQRSTASKMLRAALSVAGKEATVWTRGLLRLQTATGIATFKHPGFSHEREIRLAVPRMDQKVLFRASQGRLIPYSEVARYFPDAPTNTGKVDRLPIIEIVCAPNSKDATLATVQRLLRAYEYVDVKVTRSHLPLG